MNISCESFAIGKHQIFAIILSRVQNIFMNADESDMYVYLNLTYGMYTWMPSQLVSDNHNARLGGWKFKAVFNNPGNPDSV